MGRDEDREHACLTLSTSGGMSVVKVERVFSAGEVDSQGVLKVERVFSAGEVDSQGVVKAERVFSAGEVGVAGSRGVRRQ